jgi:hypothetical protein
MQQEIEKPLHLRHYALRHRRICVCGGTLHTPERVTFCKRLGWELAGEKSFIFITGGFRSGLKEPNLYSADYATIIGARNRFNTEKIQLTSRIETFLPEMDTPDIKRFRIGKVHILHNRTRQARRFTLVGASDAIVAVEGHENTREIIDLSFALEKPCLPLPFAGGVSVKRWHENRSLIQEWFSIDTKTAREIEKIQLDTLSQERINNLARRIKELLSYKIKRKCFIIMPFDSDYLPLYLQAIKPAVLKCGFTPIRADHLNLVGNAVEVLHQAINTCDCAIAVITTFNPNVMYELGFSHALKKPIIILCKGSKNRGRIPLLPFDLRNEFVIDYTDDLKSLQNNIINVLQELAKQ